MILRTPLFLTLAIAAPVAAAPRVDLDRCVAFDAAELARAIDRELPVDAGEHPYVVVVQCPDLVTAIMQVEPEPASGAVARTLDLGEVPTDLRLKLLALAAAEMVKVATTLSAPTSPPRVPMVVSAPPRPQPQPKPLVREAPRSEPMSFSISPRVGIRMFELTPTHPVATFGAEVGTAPFRVGIEGGAGQASGPYGRIRTWMATVTVAYELCGGAATSWCVLARGELGEAGTDTTSTTDIATPNDLRHTYVQVGPSVELAHRFDRWSFVAELDAGYSWGLIADDPTIPASASRVFAMAGLVGVAQLGVRWQ